MLNVVGLCVMFASALLVAVADFIIKKISNDSFFEVIINPWMLLICFLYFLQIILAVYIFINNGDFAVYGNLYIVFYSILMVLGGIFFFQESLTSFQYFGIVLALLGGLLINGYKFGL